MLATVALALHASMFSAELLFFAILSFEWESKNLYLFKRQLYMATNRRYVYELPHLYKLKKLKQTCLNVK